MKNSIIRVITLVSILVISFSSCQTTTKDAPGDKVIELYDALKNQDFNKASTLYVTNKGEKLTDEEAKLLEGLFEMGSDNFTKKEGLDKITIVEEQLSEDGIAADVTYTIHYKNGETDNETVTLNKFDGIWFIKVTNF